MIPNWTQQEQWCLSWTKSRRFPTKPRTLPINQVHLGLVYFQCIVLKLRVPPVQSEHLECALSVVIFECLLGSRIGQESNKRCPNCQIWHFLMALESVPADSDMFWMSFVLTFLSEILWHQLWILLAYIPAFCLTSTLTFSLAYNIFWHFLASTLTYSATLHGHSLCHSFPDVLTVSPNSSTCSMASTLTCSLLFWHYPWHTQHLPLTFLWHFLLKRHSLRGSAQDFSRDPHWASAQRPAQRSHCPRVQEMSTDGGRGGERRRRSRGH